jgi:hypothetical protein
MQALRGSRESDCERSADHMKPVCALLLLAALILGLVAVFTSYNSIYLLALCCAFVAVGVAGHKARNEL